MRNYKFRKSRCLLARGASIIAITLLLLGATGCHRDKSTDSKIVQPTTTEASTTCTTTSTGISSTTHSTTTTTVTEKTTTSTAATSLRTEITQPTTETVVSIETEPVQYSYADSEAVLLAQLINKEASATYEGKLAVGSVVLNRMNYFGQSMTEVIYAPNQFTTCYSLGYYTDTDYQAAVEVLTYGSTNNAMFFNGCHPDCKNWFYDINYNYLGAW